DYSRIPGPYGSYPLYGLFLAWGALLFWKKGGWRLVRVHWLGPWALKRPDVRMSCLFIGVAVALEVTLLLADGGDPLEFEWSRWSRLLLITPIVEELVYRGTVLAILLMALGAKSHSAVLISALFFASHHYYTTFAYSLWCILCGVVL